MVMLCFSSMREQRRFYSALWIDLNLCIGDNKSKHCHIVNKNFIIKLKLTQLHGIQGSNFY